MAIKSRKNVNGFVVIELPKPNSPNKIHYDFSIYYPFRNLTPKGRRALSSIVANILLKIFSRASCHLDDEVGLNIHKTNNGHYTLRTKGLPFVIIEQILDEKDTISRILLEISDQSKGPN